MKTIEQYQADPTITVEDDSHEEPDLPGFSHLITDGDGRRYTIYFNGRGEEIMDVSGWQWEPFILPHRRTDK